MKNYVSEEENCPTREDRDEAIRVAQFLKIKEFTIFDFREEYNDLLKCDGCYRHYKYNYAHLRTTKLSFADWLIEQPDRINLK